MKTNAIKNRTRLELVNTKAKELPGRKHRRSYNMVKADNAKNLYLLGVPVKVICREVYIAKSTLYNFLKKEGVCYDSYIRASLKLKN